jgi:hypothetical protein
MVAVLTEDVGRRAPPAVEAAHLESLIGKRINIERSKAVDIKGLPAFGTGTNRKLGQPVLMRAGRRSSACGCPASASGCNTGRSACRL